MTQTVIKTRHNKGGTVVSIYSHPNNWQAPIGACTWCYDVIVRKVSVKDVLMFYVDTLACSDSDEDTEALQEAIYHIASVARGGFVWEVSEGDSRGNGCLDLRLSIEQRYHATKANALNVAQSQYC